MGFEYIFSVSRFLSIQKVQYSPHRLFLPYMDALAVCRSSLKLQYETEAFSFSVLKPIAAAGLFLLVAHTNPDVPANPFSPCPEFF